jgi:dTDP-glucose 4,6-dehydratase
MGQPSDAFDHVNDRPGGDRRYAINPEKLINDLGWQAHDLDFEAGLRKTIDWYTNHPQWWGPDKETTENRYRQAGH